MGFEMRIYDYNFLETVAIPSDIVSFLVQIHEYKVRQANFYRQQPDVLSRLVEVAKIQSTGASNRIEGIYTTDQRLQELKRRTCCPLQIEMRKKSSVIEQCWKPSMKATTILILNQVLFTASSDLYKFSPTVLVGTFKSTE